jgi:Na+/melibiose symporter-like transporter
MVSLNENGKSCPHQGLILRLSTDYTVFVFQRNVMKAVAETNNEENMQHTKESFERHGILRATTFVLEGLSLVFGFMYDNNMQHIRDYYVVVCKNPVVGSAARNVSAINLLASEFGI